MDFGRYVAGPWCAQLLLGMGAEVLRVERPGGGEDRFLFPLAEDMGAYLLHCNRGKRSMTLNPTKPAGREIVAKLVAWADIVVANMPDDSLTTMGLDWESVHAANPRAVRGDILIRFGVFNSESSNSGKALIFKRTDVLEVIHINIKTHGGAEKRKRADQLSQCLNLE